MITLEKLIKDQTYGLVSGLYFPPPESPKVYLDDSSVHGKGVFAKQNIKSGDFLTMYPPHYAVYFPDGRGEWHREMTIASNLTDSLPITHRIRTRYGYHINEHINICGHPDLVDNPAFLGHMINDGARGHSNRNEYSNTKVPNERDYTLYNTISKLKSNCKFEHFYPPPFSGIKLEIIYIIATKDIAEGEELFITYGYQYWIENN